MPAQETGRAAALWILTCAVALLLVAGHVSAPGLQRDAGGTLVGYPLVQA